MGAPSAQAASPTLVYGGGSTLAAKVYRDIFNCFSTVADGLFSTTPGTYPAGASIQYPVGENSYCTTQGTKNEITLYEPVGSGGGLAAWTTGVPADFGTPKTSNTIAYLDSTFGIKATPYPEIQFAASDAYLNATQASQAQTAVGETVFQLPTFVTPIVMGIGGVQNVKLTETDVCNLFASAASKTAAGQKISAIVVRSDSSGTSFIFADWLHQNCAANLGFSSTNGFPSTTPNWSAVATLNGNHLPILQGSGSGGEASTIVANPDSIGYVSPDYTYPVVPTGSPYPAYVNGQQPTVAAVKNRLVHETYPTTYNTATIGQQINDQLVAPGGVGYPIIGYTFIDTYSCYSVSIDGGLIGNPSQGALLKQVLNLFYSSNKQIINILESQGFVEPSVAVYSLLTGTGGPLNATSGIQNGSCPAK
jgi:ABC-type phosphate transport system substrate-binding protein